MAVRMTHVETSWLRPPFLVTWASDPNAVSCVFACVCACVCVCVCVCGHPCAQKWTHWDLNPGPSACEADVIPLHHEPYDDLAQTATMRRGLTMRRSKKDGRSLNSELPRVASPRREQ